MDVRTNNRVDSAPPTVLPFPQERVRRKHARASMDAAGFLTLLIMDRENEPTPANVQRIDEPDGPEFPSKSAALMLAILIFEALTPMQRERIKRTVRGLAYTADPLLEARQLQNVLSRHMLNGRE